MRARYPSVIGEFDTLKALVAGASIARYGDGELKMCRVETPPVGIKSQRGDTALSDRLREILIDSGDCLVGIPNIHDVVKEHVSDQKVEHWARHAMYLTYLIDRPYYSSFITRPDSAPWIHTLDRPRRHRRQRQREIPDHGRPDRRARGDGNPGPSSACVVRVRRDS
jgi:hypothetical protein